MEQSFGRLIFEDIKGEIDNTVLPAQHNRTEI